MNQVRKFHGEIEDMLNNLKEIERLFNEGYYYYRIIKSTSLPDKLFYSQHSTNYYTGIDVVLNPLIVSFTRKVDDACLVNSRGCTSYGEYSYEPERLKKLRHVYKWDKSYSRLKELGFFVNDIFILEVMFK